MITVELPKALGMYVNGSNVVEITEPCGTIRDALWSLGRRAPGVLDRVMDESGEVRTHVNVFLDDENMRFLAGLDTPVKDRSTILILAAVSGG